MKTIEQLKKACEEASQIDLEAYWRHIEAKEVYEGARKAYEKAYDVYRKAVKEGG